MTAAQLLRIELIVLIAGFAIAVFWKLVTGRISTQGLLKDKIADGFSPARLQLMIATLLGAAFYASEIGQASGTAFPEPGPELLAIAGGSNLIHLGGKFLGLRRLIGSLER